RHTGTKRDWSSAVCASDLVCSPGYSSPETAARAVSGDEFVFGGGRRQRPGAVMPSAGDPTSAAAARSAIMIVGAFVLPVVTCGMIEASARRSLDRPWTANVLGSTTAS